jgi:hypothetical protein
MAMNVLNIWGEIFGIAGGALILILFAVTFSPLVTHYRIPHRRMDETSESEGGLENQVNKNELEVDKIRAQDYVESFNGDITGGRGALPLVVSVFSIGLIIWWAIYLVTNWSQYLWSVRSFWR